MLSTRPLAHSALMLSLVLLLRKSHSRDLRPASLYASSELQNSSFLEHHNVVPYVIDVGTRPANWDAYVEKGKSGYREWAAAGPNDLSNGPLFAAISTNIIPEPDRLTPGQRAIMSTSMHYGQEDQYYEYDFRGSTMNSLGPEWGIDLDDMWFKSQVNAKWGIMMISEWHTGPDSGDQVAVEADILWAMWKDAAQRKLARDGPRRTLEQQLRRLHTIVVYPINDQDTIDLLYFVMDSERVDTFDVNTEGDNSEFWALLGSPVGTVIQSLLIAHKGPLKGKRVHSMTVFSERWLDRLDEESEGEGPEGEGPEGEGPEGEEPEGDGPEGEQPVDDLPLQYGLKFTLVEHDC